MFAPGVDKGTVMFTVFDNAIAAHIRWLVRFEGVLVGRSRDQFDSEHIGDHTICEFGLWLRSNPSLFPNAERFKQVKNLHKSFHEKAATLAVMLRSQARGDIIQADWRALCDLSDQLIECVYEEIKHPQRSSYRRNQVRLSPPSAF